jgi:hypothetical protein
MDFNVLPQNGKRRGRKSRTGTRKKRGEFREEGTMCNL